MIYGVDHLIFLNNSRSVIAEHLTIVFLVPIILVLDCRNQLMYVVIYFWKKEELAFLVSMTS